MNLQKGSFQPEYSFQHYESIPEPDVRKEPNYLLLLFVLLVGLFAVCLAVIYFTKGELPLTD